MVSVGIALELERNLDYVELCTELCEANNWSLCPVSAPSLLRSALLSVGTQDNLTQLKPRVIMEHGCVVQS